LSIAFSIKRCKQYPDIPSRSFYTLSEFRLAVLTDEIMSIAKPKIKGGVASRDYKLYWNFIWREKGNL